MPEPLPPQSHRVQTPLGLVEYAEHGQGEPLLSFHGTPGGYDGALLAAGLHCGDCFRRIGFSRPGYLRTPLASGSDVYSQADIAAALLDALSIPDVLVYALSGGGPFAIEFAARHPRRCRKLLLASAVTGPDPRPRVQLELELQALRLLDPAAWFMRKLAPNREISNILGVLAPFSSRAAGYRNDAAVFANYCPGGRGRISLPTLIVHGARDRFASFHNARCLASLIPNCETLFVKEAGHIDLMSRPEVKKRVAAYLGREA